MRVITGSARGRRLKTPENYDIRPTTDNVKESVFNIIQFDIEGRRVLDLFAGTGQLGIECLSRGAESAVFVDKDRAAGQIVRDNLNGGIIICEARRERQLPDMTAPYAKRKEYSYGKVKVCIYTKENA